MSEYIIIAYHGKMDGRADECDLLGYERVFAKEIPCWVHLWHTMGKWCIGQHQPKHEVSEQWLRTYKEKLWINCNDLEGSDRLMQIDADFRYIHWNDSALLHSTCAYDIGRTNKGDVIAGNGVEKYNSECIVYRPEYGTIKDLTSVRGIVTSWTEMALTMRM